MYLIFFFSKFCIFLLSLINPFLYVYYALNILFKIKYSIYILNSVDSFFILLYMYNIIYNMYKERNYYILIYFQKINYWLFHLEKTLFIN